MMKKNLVLVGGGHTHALVLAAWRAKGLPDTRVVLVNPGPTAPYSGMLPGFVAGHYSHAQLQIDLAALCMSTGATLVQDSAVALDPQARLLHLQNGAPVPFDVLSMDVGITTAMPALDGFAQHATAAKPLGAFAARWAQARDSDGAIAVIGGGVAGAELAMAMAQGRRAVQGRGRAVQGPMHLIDRSEVLAEVPQVARARLLRALSRNGVQVHVQRDVTRLTATHVHLANHPPIAAAFKVGVAGAHPHDWMQATGLALKDGFIRVDAQLQTSVQGVFAVGDCAHMDHAPRPKAGVFAVRQAPVLAANLSAALNGGTMQAYAPQADYLKLISLGRKSALGVYRGRAFSGPLVWRLKDWIDRRFMAQF